MWDDPITPIQPIHAVREVEEGELRRHPTMGQLRQWLMYSRRKAKERRQREAATEGFTLPKDPP